MSVTFTDDDLHSWEAYPTGGDCGLSINPRIVFNCVSAPTTRPRYVEVPGDEADAQSLVQQESLEELKAMLARSVEIE